MRDRDYPPRSYVHGPLATPKAIMGRPSNSERDKPLREAFQASDYRSVIVTTLAERPFDEESVHDCVCTYVRAERDTGRSPSDVIVALTELVEQTGIAPPRVRHALTRRVIPWCVEAYFGTRAASLGGSAPSRIRHRRRVDHAGH